MNLITTTLVCPACSAKFKLEDATRNIEVLEFARLAARFGVDWPLIESYLACFRTDTGKALRPERARILVDELWKLWQTRCFTRKKVDVHLHMDVLRSGLRAVGQKSDTLFGFHNHNYLLETLARMQKDFDREQAKAERIGFARDSSGASRVEPEESAPPPQEIQDFLTRTSEQLGKGSKLITGGFDGTAESGKRAQV